MSESGITVNENITFNLNVKTRRPLIPIKVVVLQHTIQKRKGSI